MRSRLAWFGVTAVFFATGLFSQTTSTEVLGTVTDPTGALVPGAKVTLLRTSTGQQREAATSPEGNYSFPLIDIGEYTVTVEASGFKTQQKSGLQVQLNQKVRVDFLMEVGATTERIEVSATGVTLRTEDQAVGQVIDNKRVVELPLNGRNVAGLAVLIPGVQFGIRMGMGGTGGFPIPGNGVAISANGQREVNQQVTLDGVIATEPRVNTAAFSPSIDALEEFKVLTSSYSAEYGQNSGAIMQMVVKGGTNSFRATFWEFLRNDKLAAADYFLNFQIAPGARPAEKNRLRRNQFGTFVSGPVILPKIYNGRDRTFWSFNYEGRRETRENVRETRLAPQAFRNGDFSAIAGRQNIWDPLAGTLFPGNVIPASRIYAPAQKFLNDYSPLPQFATADPLDPVNYRSSVADTIPQNQFMFRIDHQFSSKDRVFVRWIRDRGEWNQGFVNPFFPYFVSATAWNLGTQWVRIITPSVVNEFRFGINVSDNDTFNPRTNTGFDLDSLGIGQFRVATDGNRKFTDREVGIPNVGLGGWGIPGDRDGGNGFDRNDVYQFTDNLSWTRGKHTVKTGIEFRWLALDRAAANVPRGGMTLSANEAGLDLAGWLLGYPATTTTGEGLPFTSPRQNRWSAYIVDDWKVSRKLTLNLGVRMDLFQIPKDTFGSWRSLRLDILSRGADGREHPTVIPEPGTKNWPPYDTEGGIFMPRVGFAYRATDRWVVRGGVGLFANAQQLNNYTILNLQAPTSGTVGFNAVTVAAPNGARQFAPGSTIITLANAFPGATTPTGRRNVILVPPDNRSSRHVQWSLDIQRDLGWNTLLTVGYVGSKTSNMDNTVNWNNPDPSPSTDINARRPYQTHVSRGETDTVRLLGAIRYLDSYANAFYHGLQTSLEKRYSSGFVFGIAYTYSKSHGEGYGRNEGQLDVPNTYQNPRDRRASRARFGFDVTHNFVSNFVYEMPFLNRFTGVAGAFLAGWQTNGILTLRTGFPMTAAGGNLNTGGPTTANRLGDGRLFGAANRQLWFDPAAFQRTDCNIAGRGDLCTYGSAAFDTLVTPGTKTLDFSVYKNWKLPVSEVSRLQFRAEFFNLTNTPQFGAPNNLSWVGNTLNLAPRVGEIRTLRLPMRIIQFALKLYF